MKAKVFGWPKWHFVGSFWVGFTCLDGNGAGGRQRHAARRTVLV